MPAALFEDLPCCCAPHWRWPSEDCTSSPACRAAKSRRWPEGLKPPPPIPRQYRAGGAHGRTATWRSPPVRCPASSWSTSTAWTASSTLRRLEAEHGALPPTVEAITGNGRHIYFAMPDTPVRNTASKIGDSIDTRGDGGYVLVPPSVHPSGRCYAWSVDSASTFAAAPDWLLAKIGKPNGNGAMPTPPAQWRDLVLGGVGEGRRNDTVTRLAGYLLRRHIDPVVALEFLAAWNAVRCQPPLDAAEVAGIVDSIAGRELKRRGAG